VGTVEITLDRLEAAEAQLELWGEGERRRKGKTPILSHLSEAKGHAHGHAPSLRSG